MLSLHGYGQPDVYQTIRGVIVDKQSQEPLPGVNVFIPGTAPVIGTVTGQDGTFRIEKISPGRITLRSSCVGYNPAVLAGLLVVSGKETVVRMEMEEAVIETGEVVVKALQHKDRPLNEMAQVSARSFTVEETERYAGTWFDPARMAANYAGVMAVADQRNDIIIRGNSPAGLLWRLEGVNIPNPNHFGTLGTTGGPISILNNNLLTNSDFYTGAFPAEYGNSLSGVFDLKMRTGNNEKREYVAQAGLNGFEFGLEGPFRKRVTGKGKSSYLLNYRYSTLGVFNALGIRFGVSAIPQYQDLSFKLNFPSTRFGSFSLFGIGGKSFVDLSQSKQKASDWTFGRTGFNTRYGSDMGAAGLTHLLFFGDGSRLRTTLAVSGSRATTRADSASWGNPGKPYYRDNSWEVITSLSGEYRKKFSARDHAGVGISAEWFGVHYLDSLYLRRFGKMTELTSTKGRSMALLQGFAEVRHRFSEALSLYGGLHSQFFTLNGSFSLEPRLSLSWDLGGEQTLGIGTGMHSQLQPRLFYFLQTHPSDSVSLLTNKNLGFSRSDQAVISYDVRLAPDWRFKAESYYQHLTRIPVEQRPSYFSIINYGSEYYGTRADSLVNRGTGYNCGLELTLEKFLSGNYYLLFTASFFDSKYRGSDGILRNTLYNGNYVLNALGGYSLQLGKYHSLSLDMKTVSAGGKRYIPVDMNASRTAGDRVFDYSQAYCNRFPAYFRLDGRITLKMNLKKVSTELAFDVQNITDKKNIFLETYDSASGSIRYDYQLGTFYVALWRMLF